MAGAPHQSGAGRRQPRQEPFGPADVTPGLAGQAAAARRAHQAQPKPRTRTPNDRQVWSQIDQAQHDAYQAGYHGDPVPEGASEADTAAHHAGRQDRAGEDRQAHDSARNAQTGGTIRISDDGAGFLLGMFGYCLAINYIRYGWPGVTGWLSAKFVNKVTLTGAAAAGHQTPPTPPYWIAKP